MADTMAGSQDGQKRKVTDLVRNASPFARSLMEGLMAGLVVFLLLVGWMSYRADRTAERVQPLLPYKSADIDMGKPAAVQQAVNPSLPADGSAPVASLPLPVAPLAGLTETKGNLTLPIARISDDMTPFQAYKRPFAPIAGKAPVAIVITDFGLSDSFSQSALDNLPADISFVLTPYADNAVKWAAAARNRGHEFWMGLPMETKDAADTGPYALKINASLDENQQHMFSVLAGAQGYAGVVTQKNHVFTAQDIDTSPILKQIYGRGLALAESNPDGVPFGQKMAAESGFPFVQNTMWLDTDLRPESIDRALQALEISATKNGHAIAFVQPYPVVLNKIQDWARGAQDRGLQLAPLSALVQ